MPSAGTMRSSSAMSLPRRTRECLRLHATHPRDELVADLDQLLFALAILRDHLLLDVLHFPHRFDRLCGGGRERVEVARIAAEAARGIDRCIVAALHRECG